ncbi:putative pentatricopeptide repeat-containing protein, mitochondrial [Iris pallida]|uniref:Pentatricopeptide repeat-containing protein, mitochondrial n=1 Tax=Iris pallida TaxID=29817 RepID=A0AAX6H376_IRIPA|nr:putative pentatricopeptide repeat-containing protein, mitochondrial [Iris pallida]
MYSSFSEAGKLLECVQAHGQDDDAAPVELAGCGLRSELVRGGSAGAFRFDAWGRAAPRPVRAGERPVRLRAPRRAVVWEPGARSRREDRLRREQIRSELSRGRALQVRSDRRRVGSVRGHGAEGRRRVEHYDRRAVPERPRGRGDLPVRSNARTGRRDGLGDLTEGNQGMHPSGIPGQGEVDPPEGRNVRSVREDRVEMAMVDMYAKCGDVATARRVFDGIREKNNYIRVRKPQHGRRSRLALLPDGVIGD